MLSPDSDTPAAPNGVRFPWIERSRRPRRAFLRPDCASISSKKGTRRRDPPLI
jgi:hypothetical protein